MPTDTETLDKLYLEWSQFTSARTAREIAADRGNRRLYILPLPCIGVVIQF